MLGRYSQKGDTMIEVLLSVTIFSVVAVMGLTIMNQGQAAAQRSLEVTLVRQEMNAQATALRFMYDAALAQERVDGATPASNSAMGKWKGIIDHLRKPAATAFGAMVTGNSCTPISSIDSAFVVNAKTATVFPRSTSGIPGVTPSPAKWRAAEVYSRVRYNPSPATDIAWVDGIWIEAVRGNPVSVGGVTTPGYTDFHIRACWATVGQARSATLGTIVRLYEP